MQGLDPDRVRDLLARARAAITVLDDAAHRVDSALWLARDASARAEPGDLVLAPHSYGAAEGAAARVRGARESAWFLIERAHADALDQEAASAADDTSIPSIGPVWSNQTGRAPLPSTPAWVDQSMLGADVVGAALLAAGVTRLDGRFLQFGRQQWVNHRTSPHFRFRPGLIQPAGSSYRNNPSSWRYRPVPPPAWASNFRVPAWVTTGGKALGPIGAVVTGVSSSWNAGAEEWNRSGDTARAVSRGGITGAGAVAGAVAGAKGGALIGAAIGSIFPGPGTVIGGALGGLIGGIVGASVGEQAGSAAADAVDDAAWGD